MWWITIYVGSRKGVKKIYFFLKKEKCLKYIIYFDLSLDEKLVRDNPREKREREREIKIRAEWWKSFRGITNF